MRIYKRGMFGLGIDIWRFSIRWHLWKSRSPEHARDCNGLSFFFEYTPKS